MIEATPIAVVVLDRDGTVIEDRHYIKREDDVVFLPGAIEALRKIRAKGYPIFLVSNQSGVGRGWIADDEFQGVHRRFTSMLTEAGTQFDEIAYCFHAPEANCDCRKPKTGLVPLQFQGQPIDWSRSFVVGDHVPDMGLASALGAKPCLVLTGKGPETQKTELPVTTQIYENLSVFADALPEREGTRRYTDTLKSNLGLSIQAKQQMMERTEDLRVFSEAVAVVVKAYRNGGRLYIAGNGGSAADAQHLAAEFVSKLARPRAPLPAEALTVDTSILTAIGNDFSFDEVFSRQIEGKARDTDVFLGITTSGQSRNIVRALEVCRKLKIPSIVLSGRDGGKVKDLADFCIIAAGVETSAIQEVHMVLYHTLCACVEAELFPI